MSAPAIQVEGLGKQYKLGLRAKAAQTLPEALINAAWAPIRRFRTLAERSTGADLFWALQDVSFQVNAGEVVGIIGRNGAGKTTLLKILSRITEPTTGRAVIRGRIGTLLEVGTGFHPELTGRENVYLNGAILGMRRSEVIDRFDQIVDFAGIERFLDTPVKRYSSGMCVRLGFAVAAHLEPEILFVDEVLAVGDAAFQKKCLGKLADVSRAGRTVLFISHNMSAIQGLCDTCILLEQGRTVTKGPAREVISGYLADSFASAGEIDLKQRRDRTGSGRIRVYGFHLEDAAGRRVAVVQSGQPCTFVFEYECRDSRCRNVSFAFGVSDHLGTFLFRNFTSDAGQDFPEIEGDGAFRCHVPRLPLRSGRYLLGLRVTVEGDESDYIRANAAAFEVESGDFYGSGRQSDHAPILVDHDWSVRPATVGAVCA